MFSWYLHFGMQLSVSFILVVCLLEYLCSYFFFFCLIFLCFTFYCFKLLLFFFSFFIENCFPCQFKKKKQARTHAHKLKEKKIFLNESRLKKCNTSRYTKKERSWRQNQNYRMRNGFTICTALIYIHIYTGNYTYRTTYLTLSLNNFYLRNQYRWQKKKKKEWMNEWMNEFQYVFKWMKKWL